MNYKCGELICPKCGRNGMNGHKKWISREEYNNNQLITKYIFYDDLTHCKWTCCKVCFCDENCRRIWANLLACGYYEGCNEVLIWGYLCAFPCAIVFYILFFIWIDIINCLCCIKKSFYKVQGKKTKESIEASRIWNEIQGISDIEYNQQFLSKCDNCKYESKNLEEFILTYNLTHSTKGENININEKLFAINFSSPNINFCTTCKKSDKFYAVQQKLYEEYPILRNKSIYFLANGEVVDNNKTIEECGINPGCNILINEIEPN